MDSNVNGNPDKARVTRIRLLIGHVLSLQAISFKHKSHDTFKRNLAI